jgi:hypothetical protein
MMLKKIIVLLTLMALPAFGFNPNTDDSLVGWWALDDGDGSTAVDGSGNGNDGTLEGDASWAAGYLGSAVEFDGDGDYIDIGNDEIFDLTEEVTLALWINPNNLLNGQHTQWLGKGDHTYAIKHHENNSVEFFVYEGTWNAVQYPDSDNSWNGEWRHVAGTFDGSDLLIYVDGEEVASESYSGGIETRDHNVRIGENSESTGRYYEGKIDDARIYSRALTADEIRMIMTGGFNPGLATNPSPINKEDDLPLNTILSWTPGAYPGTHNVYFSANFDDVNDGTALISEQQDANIYDPGVLDF